MCDMLNNMLTDRDLRRADWKQSELVKVSQVLGIYRPGISRMNSASLCSFLNNWRIGTVATTTQCMVCETNFPSDERLETHCGNLIDYCATCMEKWLSSQPTSLSPQEVACPANGCTAMLSPEDLEDYLPCD